MNAAFALLASCPGAPGETCHAGRCAYCASSVYEAFRCECGAWLEAEQAEALRAGVEIVCTCGDLLVAKGEDMDKPAKVTSVTGCEVAATNAILASARIADWLGDKLGATDARRVLVERDLDGAVALRALGHRAQREARHRMRQQAWEAAASQLTQAAACLRAARAVVRLERARRLAAPVVVKAAARKAAA